MKTAAEQQAWEAHAAGLAAKLLAILERHTRSSGLAYAVPPTPLAGGFWASLYRFRLAQAPAELSGELVLRIVPAGDEDCLREAAVQGAVAAAGFPAPRVHLSGGRDAGLGFPFMIMAHAPGAALRLRTLWRLPEVLAETMARLHALDEAPVRAALAKAGVPLQELAAVLDDLAARSAPLGDAGFAAGMAWLRAHRPAPGRGAICHGDLHPLNLVMADGRVSGVLDWTHARLAEPAFDVAYTSQLIELWPLEGPLPRRLLKPLGRVAAWRFVSAYRRRAPLEPARLAWYEALHSFRVLVRVARAHRGITLPPLPASHPWELVAEDAARAFQRHTAIRIELPQRCEPPAAS